MAQPERFEILILGSGKGGKLLAWEMARSGRRTAVVERRYIGGSCPNINCLPSKNEIWSAKVAYLVRHNLAGTKLSTRDRLVPYCMFTEPPLARVGLTEGDARRQGVPVRVPRLPTSAVLRTETTDETQGFMKALVAGSDDRILGFAMIGAEAGEVMAVVQTAMLADLPYPKLRDAILAHPTMAEGLGSLFANVPPRAVRQITPKQTGLH
jgi:pyruvate/2-oxoglutarate dehydrogenase complex dihydrolipoamide dehydrogenase (E3) component